MRSDYVDARREKLLNRLVCIRVLYHEVNIDVDIHIRNLFLMIPSRRKHLLITKVFLRGMFQSQIPDVWTSNVTAWRLLIRDSWGRAEYSSLYNWTVRTLKYCLVQTWTLNSHLNWREEGFVLISFMHNLNWLNVSNGLISILKDWSLFRSQHNLESRIFSISSLYC